MKYDFSKLEQHLDSYLLRNNVNAISAIVSVGEDVVFETHKGYQNIEHKTPVTKGSIYRLASMTKPVTSVAILICKDLGLLNIKDPICKYLPSFEKMYINKGTLDYPIKGRQQSRFMTIFDLLTHSSGLGTDLEIKQYNNISPDNIYSLETIVNEYSHFLMNYDLDTQTDYSPLVAFDILARIVEIVSKMKYPDFLKTYLFNPLGMNSASFVYTDDNIKNRVDLYKQVDGQLISFENQDMTFDCFPPGRYGGGAGLVCNAFDYLKFAIMLNQEGVYKGTRILSKESAQMLKTSALTASIKNIGDDFNWGLGVYVRPTEKSTYLSPSSFGWSGAFGTHFFCDPVHRITAVYMHNSQTYGGAFALHAIKFERDVMEAFGLLKDKKEN